MFDTKVRFPISNFQFPNLPLEKGVSLYFAVVILSVLLTMTLAISLMVMGQVKIIKGMGDSVVALNAADTGVEAVLHAPGDYATGTVYCGYLDIDGGGTAASSTDCACEKLASFPEDSCYAVKKVASGADCAADYYCIKSVGYFKKTRRAVEVAR